MSYIVYSILLLFNGCFGFWKKHCKMIAFLTFLFFWTLFWGNTDNPDLMNYMYQYNNVLNTSSVNTEIGYYFITKCFARLGFSYQWYIAIVTLICYGIIFNTIKNYTQNYNYVFLFYIIHLFIFDIIQIRNFMMMSILIFAVKYLVRNTTKDRIIYLLLICISATIHKTGIIYSLAVLIKPSDSNKVIKNIAISSVILSIITYINDGKIPILSNYLMSTFDGVVQSTYLDVYVPVKYILCLILLQFVNFGILLLSKSIIHRIYDGFCEENYKLFEHYHDKLSILENKCKFVDVVFWMNVLAFAFIPLYMESINFYRLMRNLNLLNFIVMSIVSDYLKVNDIKKIKFNIIALLSVILWFIYDLSLSFSHFQRIFENNLILGW